MTVTVRWLLISPLGCLLFREKFSSAFVSRLAAELPASR